MNDTGTGRRFLFVCTLGGHLTQLVELSRRLVGPDDTELWVTHESAQSTSLLEGRNREFLPYIEERDWAGVLKTLPAARRIIGRFEPDMVISTGSAIALAFLPTARVIGRGRIQTAFIESAAMVNGHTRTGTALQYLPGNRLFTQSEATTDDRWTYIGSVFDGFEATPTAPTAPTGPTESATPNKLVVTVGTSREFGFEALIRQVAAVVPEEVEVLWQTGQTDVDHLHIDPTPWLAAAELEAAIASADVVISHAGCGSALAALTNGQRPILVARRSDRGEFNDDHQQEILAQLADRGLAVAAETDTLTWDQIVEAAAWRVTRTSDEGDHLDLGFDPNPRTRTQR